MVPTYSSRYRLLFFRKSVFFFCSLWTVDAFTEPCQDSQLSACVEECKIKCRNIEIRPFVNRTGLLRVPFSECITYCEDACQKTDVALNKDLKTQKQPLAYFVLSSRAEKGCALDQAPLAGWKEVWHMCLRWLFERLGLIEMPSPYVVTPTPPLPPSTPLRETKPPPTLEPSSVLTRKIAQPFDFPTYQSPRSPQR